MKLRAIDDESSRQQALELLREGFPTEPAGSWLGAFEAKPGRRGHGVLLDADGGAQGVMLLFERERQINGRTRRLVNLSSWYVRERHRPLAFFMMRQVVGDADTVFTNFSATETAAKVALALGFRYVSHGAICTSPRPDRLLRGPGVRTLPFDRLPLRTLDPIHAEWLADHARRPLHMVVGIEDKQDVLPAVFRLRYRKRLRLARLAFCPDHARLARVLPALQRRMLLRHGVVSLILPRLDAYADVPSLSPPKTGPSILIKGDLADHEVDLLYSELSYLPIRGR